LFTSFAKAISLFDFSQYPRSSVQFWWIGPKPFVPIFTCEREEVGKEHFGDICFIVLEENQD